MAQRRGGCRRPLSQSPRRAPSPPLVRGPRHRVGMKGSSCLSHSMAICPFVLGGASGADTNPWSCPGKGRPRAQQARSPRLPDTRLTWGHRELQVRTSPSSLHTAILTQVPTLTPCLCSIRSPPPPRRESYFWHPQPPVPHLLRPLNLPNRAGVGTREGQSRVGTREGRRPDPAGQVWERQGRRQRRLSRQARPWLQAPPLPGQPRGGAQPEGPLRPAGAPQRPSAPRASPRAWSRGLCRTRVLPASGYEHPGTLRLPRHPAPSTVDASRKGTPLGFGGMPGGGGVKPLHATVSRPLGACSGCISPNPTALHSDPSRLLVSGWSLQ